MAKEYIIMTVLVFEILNSNLIFKQSVKKESGSNWSRSPIFKSNNCFRNIYDHCKKKHIATSFIGICALEIVIKIYIWVKSRYWALSIKFHFSNRK